MLLVFFGGTPDTYQTAGRKRGTATSTSTRPGTTSGEKVGEIVEEAGEKVKEAGEKVTDLFKK
ncbi:hypothetical protein [Mycobacterium kiyosense]|uniref:hypothetical protein n=1 Tax=Mycobacterium kiyosense TaxID=2871094 RepID=UPI00222EF76F|nr:hypothetical protein [Mycobacterium kiyosense]